MREELVNYIDKLQYKNVLFLGRLKQYVDSEEHLFNKNIRLYQQIEKMEKEMNKI